MIRCTVGVMAYNEEQNIIQILHALLNQNRSVCQIEEIVVVASGCTDRTVELAEAVAREHPMIKLDVQAERAGKAAAINRLISIAGGEVIVLVGADTLPDPTALEQLVRPFEDPLVGMTGARVVPLNDPRTFMGFTAQMLWRMHHRLALRWPKLGELVAFRNLVPELPLNSATDEVALEALITARGYRLVYAPEAIVYNYGPQTLGDFLIQRRRIFAGHLHIAATQSYVAASIPIMHLFRLAFDALDRYPDWLPWMVCAVTLECWARLLGTMDFLLGHSHQIWRPVRTAKLKHQHNQTLTLVAMQCRAGSIGPVSVMRGLRRIPASEGSLCWWDQEHSQVLFMLGTQPSSASALEDRVKALAEYISSPSAPAMLDYRVVHLAPLLSLQAGA
jgi:glycosyltransferase involved in cell wall biosynthesis